MAQTHILTNMHEDDQYSALAIVAAVASRLAGAVRRAGVAGALLGGALGARAVASWSAVTGGRAAARILGALRARHDDFLCSGKILDIDVSNCRLCLQDVHGNVAAGAA